MKLRPFYLILLTSYILLACSPSLPSGIMDEDDMTDVLVDFHLAQGMAEAQGENVDVNRYKYIQAVFKKHRITEAEFDSSMIYWSGRAEDFTHIYDNVVTRVQAQAERMGLELAANNQDQFASLTNDSFTMKADTTFRIGDSFIWRFNTQYVGRSMNNEAIALLTFYYDGDTTACVTDLLRTREKNEIRHTPGRTLDSLNLRSITGFIYLPLIKGADQPKPLLVSQMQLIRMHKKQPIAPKLPVDTLRRDTLQVDTAPKQKERLTPLQVRESQPKERKIHVTKENPNPIRPQKGIPQRTNRRRGR